MAEETEQQGADQRPAQTFRIRKVYLKDVSFESPAAPGIFSVDTEWQPKIGLQLDSEHNRLDESLYEVVLTVTVSATHGEHTVFLVEAKQAGLFEVAGFEGEGLRHVLASYCAGMLFPYARETVTDLVAKGGLPQLVLQPINFDAVYAQERAKEERQAEQARADVDEGSA